MPLPMPPLILLNRLPNPLLLMLNMKPPNNTPLNPVPDDARENHEGDEGGEGTGLDLWAEGG